MPHEKMLRGINDMAMILAPRRQGLGFFAIRWLVAFLAVLCAFAASAESVDSLAQVKTLYVAAFTGGPEAAHLQQSFVRRLAKGRFQLVQSPKSSLGYAPLPREIADDQLRRLNALRW